MQLHTLDWLVIFAYLAFAVIVGLVLRKRASSNIDEYFLSGRTLPWWLAGTSMVATSFAADTPLVISGWVRDFGIWKNWLWWCQAISGMLSVFIFSRWWRRAGVMTKAELIELRYSGRSAVCLRGFLGLLHSLVTNTMVLCWVLLAAAKILDVLFDMPKWQSVSIACSIAMSYALLAGFWGVVVTDFLQFVISIVGAVWLGAICFQQVGGVAGIQDALESGVLTAETVSFVPPPGASSPLDPAFWTVSITALAVYLGIAWWALETVDGGGHAIQRICASRDETQGMLAVLWYNIAHYAIRPWPWIIVGLASIIILPSIEIRSPVAGEVTRVAQDDRQITVNASATDAPITVSLRSPQESEDWKADVVKVAEGQIIRAGDLIARTDSEQAYVVMLARFLPVGLLGMVVASLLAAFMSTIDTHVNLAASYFVNDIYRRFIMPENSPGHYVVVARLASITIMVGSAIVAMNMDSIGRLFEFFLAFLAGVGPVYVMRWLWWRVTAVTEIVAIIASGTSATWLTYTAADWSALGPLAVDGNLEPAGRTVLVTLFSLATSLVSMTISTPPDPVNLVDFYRRVRPIGWWQPVRKLAPDVVTDDSWFVAFVGTLGGQALIFGALVGIGNFLLGQSSAIWLLVFAVGVLSVAWSVRRLDGSALADQRM